MKATEVRDACHLSNPLHGSAVRCVFGKRQVRADQVVVIPIGNQHAAQVRSVEDDQVVEAFPTDRSDDSFGIGVLSGTTRRDRSVADAHRPQTLLACAAISTVAITDKIPWC